jgi:serine-type D-Ala-D-Ala carboxypeptidase/endopeptidase (penicillin-binding protein 4)
MRLLLQLCALSLLASCTISKQAIVRRDLHQAEIIFQDHKGFMLYDPVTKKTLIDYQSDRYYVPASNTKVLTLFASLNILGEKVPALYYQISGDSLIIQGTGDPSFLYKYVYQDNAVYDFLKSAPQQIYFSSSNFNTAHFGPGWAWNDYNYSYSPERSALPVYGNVFKVSKPALQSTLEIEQAYFKKFFWLGDSLARTPYVMREVGGNRIDYFPGIQTKDMSWEIPFRTSPELIVELLSDTLKKEVKYLRNGKALHNKQILYGVQTDSLYKLMMQESDNFIAEQLLLVSAGVLSDTLDPEIVMRFIQDNYFIHLPDKPIWVDGSGLSRYNLVTPRSMIKIWEMLYEQIPSDRLFQLLATGGVSGTLKNSYKADEPYVFGKTGTLRNNHNLSGFIRTKSNKILIFSFMNNGFTKPTAEIRTEMERILRYIYEKY